MSVTSTLQMTLKLIQQKLRYEQLKISKALYRYKIAKKRKVFNLRAL